MKIKSVYSFEVLSLELLWHGFPNASREGDGKRLLMYWRFLAIAFISSNNYNYAKKQSTCFFSTITSYQKERKPSSYEIALSIPEESMEQISLATFLWKI